MWNLILYTYYVDKPYIYCKSVYVQYNRQIDSIF